MFQQIRLPYAFDALEPYIDELTMITHYTKHYATYTQNFNEAVAKLPQLAGKSAEEILSNLNAIEGLGDRTAIRNNGGGYYNHSLYFFTMSPSGGGRPNGALAAQIDREFGSFENFVREISAIAHNVFGSGWAWLSANKSGQLRLSSSPNQDNPLMETGGAWKPILGIDVWEHAYYLKYLNVRDDYIKAFFHVIDWNAVSQLYSMVMAN